MLSRCTIFSLLLGVMLALGLRLWSVQHIDDCTPFFRHERNAPTSMLVERGGHSVAVPCEQWAPRQPQEVLLACLVDGALGVVFLVSTLADLVETRLARKAARLARRARF